jgi:hypothetical protein
VERKRAFVVCVSNKGYRASLEERKIYRALSDPAARKLGLLRVVDESGAGYLYPAKRFEPLSLPPRVVRALAK